nr:hypothetical protein CFP56_71472 [Quercus suber]
MESATRVDESRTFRFFAPEREVKLAGVAVHHVLASSTVHLLFVTSQHEYCFRAVLDRGPRACLVRPLRHPSPPRRLERRCAMWKAAFTGRSERSDSVSAVGASSGKRKKSSFRGDSIASAPVTPASRRHGEGKSRTGSVYDHDEARSNSGYGGRPSYGTSSNSRSGALTASALQALGDREDDDGDDAWQDEDNDAQSERKSRRGNGERRRKSKSEKRDRSRSRSQSRNRSHDRKEEKKRRERDSDREKPSRATRPRGESRLGEEGASGSSRALPAMGSFEQFPGQYDAGGFVTGPTQIPAREHEMSGALPSATAASQFPGQNPQTYARPQVGPTRADSYGAAAEYYLDEGQSVHHQPGIRPISPNMLTNPDLENGFVAASAVADPAMDTGNGTAADFFSGKVSPVAFEPEAADLTTRPSKKPSRLTSAGWTRPSKNSGKISSGAPAALTALSSIATAVGKDSGGSANAGSANRFPGSRTSEDRTSSSLSNSGNPLGMGDVTRPMREGLPRPSRHNSEPATSTANKRNSSFDARVQQSNEQFTSQPGPSMEQRHGGYSDRPQYTDEPGSYYSPSGAQSLGSGSGKRPSQHNTNIPIAAAGAAAAGYAAYEWGQHSRQSPQPQMNPDPHYGGAGSGSQSHVRPATGPGSGSFINSGPNASVSMSMGYHPYHEHKGPIARLKDGLLSLITDPEDVRKMEEYTEYIGVCKYCFDPRSSPGNAPRQHHYHPRTRDSFENLRRRRSNDRIRRSTSGESLRRSASAKIDKDSRYYASEEKRRRSNNQTGMLGAGLAAAGVAAGANALLNDRTNFDDTYSVKSGHRESSARRRRSRSSSRERRRRSSHGVIDGRDEYVSVRTKNGRGEMRPSKTRSRSVSRDRLRLGAAAGLGAGAASLASRRRRQRSPPGEFVRRQSSSSSRDPSPGLGDILGFSRSSPRNRQSSANDTRYDIRQQRKPVEPGFLGGFFSQPRKPKNSRRGSHEKRKKERGFFAFSNGSSSSSDDGMAFGEGFSSRTSLPLRRKSSGRVRRRSSGEHIAATVAGISATAAALAAAQRGHRVSKRNSRPDLGVRRDVKTRQQAHPSHVHGSPGSSDDEWEDELPSGVEDASSDAESALAFGESRLSARQSMESVGSNEGLGAWGWRWGGKDKRRRAPSEVTHYTPKPSSSYYPADGNSYPGSVYEPRGRVQRSESELASTPSGPTPPMQYVDPRPLSESGSMPGSMPGAFDSPPLGRPSPAPLQQPKPLTPIKPAFTQDASIFDDERPRARRTQSSPSRSNLVGDAALIGGAALATAGIIASAGKKSRESSNVRFGFTEEQQLREDRDQRRREREENEGRRRADRTRALKEEAERAAREEDVRRREEEVRTRREDENRRAAEAKLAKSREAEQQAEVARQERERKLRAQEDARRREEDARRKREADDRRAAEARLRQDREAKKQAEAERQQLERQRREQEDAYNREQARLEEAKQEEDRARRQSEDAQRARDSDRERQREQESKYKRDAENKAEYERRRREMEAMSRVEEERTEMSRPRQEDQDFHPNNREKNTKTPTSSAWGAAAAGVTAAATVGAIMAGVEHKKDREQTQARRTSWQQSVPYTSKQVLPGEYSEGPSPPIMDDDVLDRDFFKHRRSESENVRNAQRTQNAADQVISDMDAYYQAPYQSQAEFFRPKELDQPSEGKTKVADPHGDNQIQVYHAPEDEIRSHFEQTRHGVPTGKSKHAPYGVPQLNVIAPTPPPSEGGSVRGKGSAPPSPLQSGQNVEDNEPSPSNRSSSRSERSRSISWGEDKTHIYDAQTPESFEDRDGRDSYNFPQSSHIEADRREPTIQPAEGESPSIDMGKRATAPDAFPTYDERKAVDEPREAVYQQPLYGSPSEFEIPGLHNNVPVVATSSPSTGTRDANFASFEERLPHIPGGFDDDIYEESADTSAQEPTTEPYQPVPEVMLSKKDRKKRDKATKRASTNDSEPATPVIEEEPVFQVEEPAWEPPLSKKEQKKRDKAAKRATTIEADSMVPVADDEPVAPVEEPAWEPPLSKKEQKKRDKAGKRASTFESEPPTPAAETIPLPSETPSEVPANAKSDYFNNENVASDRTTQSDRTAGDLTSDRASDRDEQPDLSLESEFNHLSKKDRKKAEREARKNGFSDVAAAVMTAGGVAAVTAAAAGDKDNDSSSSGSSKKKKSKKKLGESVRDPRDIEPAEQPATSKETSTEGMTNGTDNWESTTKDVAAPEKQWPEVVDPFQYQVRDDAASDLWSESPESKKKKKKDKKNRDSGRFNEPVASSPLRSEWKYDDYIGNATQDSEVPRTEEPVSYLNGNGQQHNDTPDSISASNEAAEAASEEYEGSFAAKSNTTSGAQTSSKTSPDNNRRSMSPEEPLFHGSQDHGRSRSVVSEPTGEQWDRRRSSKARTGSENGHNSERDRSIAASEPVGLYEAASKRAKRRSTYDDDDTASVVSTRSRRHEKDETTSSTKKDREKKGGLFGLFSRKSADAVPSSKSAARSEDISSSNRDEEEDDGERRHRRRKHRGSEYGDDDDDAKSVASESRRRHRHKEDEGAAEADFRGEVNTDSKFDSLKDNEDSRERRRSKSYQDDDNESRAASEGRRHRRRKTGDSEESPGRSRDGSTSRHRHHHRRRTDEVVAAADNNEQDDGTPVSATTEIRSMARDVTQVDQSESPHERPIDDLSPQAHESQEAGLLREDRELNLEALPALPVSRPASPKAMLETPQRPNLATRLTSTTAVPLRFPFGHSRHNSEDERRAKSFSSPASVSTPASPVSSQKKSRPSSSEIRPLYLVERNRKIEEVEDRLPSLPSSKPSSRASSVQGREDWHSAAEDPQSPERLKDLTIDTSRANQRRGTHDLLDSAETTPKASEFSRSAAHKPVRQEPQFYTWEDYERDARMHEEPDLETLPALPPSRASPQPDTHQDESSTIDAAKSAAVITAALGGLAAVAHHLGGRDDKEEESRVDEPTSRSTNTDPENSRESHPHNPGEHDIPASDALKTIEAPAESGVVSTLSHKSSTKKAKKGKKGRKQNEPEDSVTSALSNRAAAAADALQADEQVEQAQVVDPGQSQGIASTLDDRMTSVAAPSVTKVIEEIPVQRAASSLSGQLEQHESPDSTSIQGVPESRSSAAEQDAAKVFNAEERVIDEGNPTSSAEQTRVTEQLLKAKDDALAALGFAPSASQIAEPAEGISPPSAKESATALTRKQSKKAKRKAKTIASQSGEASQETGDSDLAEQMVESAPRNENDEASVIPIVSKMSQEVNSGETALSESTVPSDSATIESLRTLLEAEHAGVAETEESTSQPSGKQPKKVKEQKILAGDFSNDISEETSMAEATDDTIQPAKLGNVESPDYAAAGIRPESETRETTVVDQTTVPESDARIGGASISESHTLGSVNGLDEEVFREGQDHSVELPIQSQEDMTTTDIAQPRDEGADVLEPASTEPETNLDSADTENTRPSKVVKDLPKDHEDTWTASAAISRKKSKKDRRKKLQIHDDKLDTSTSAKDTDSSAPLEFDGFDAASQDQSIQNLDDSWDASTTVPRKKSKKERKAAKQQTQNITAAPVKGFEEAADSFSSEQILVTDRVPDKFDQHIPSVDKLGEMDFLPSSATRKATLSAAQPLPAAETRDALSAVYANSLSDDLLAQAANVALPVDEDEFEQTHESVEQLPLVTRRTDPSSEIERTVEPAQAETPDPDVEVVSNNHQRLHVNAKAVGLQSANSADGVLVSRPATESLSAAQPLPAAETRDALSAVYANSLSDDLLAQAANVALPVDEDEFEQTHESVEQLPLVTRRTDPSSEIERTVEPAQAETPDPDVEVVSNNHQRLHVNAKAVGLQSANSADGVLVSRPATESETIGVENLALGNINAGESAVMPDLSEPEMYSDQPHSREAEQPASEQAVVDVRPAEKDLFIEDEKTAANGLATGNTVDLPSDRQDDGWATTPKKSKKKAKRGKKTTNILAGGPSDVPTSAGDAENKLSPVPEVRNLSTGTLENEVADPPPVARPEPSEILAQETSDAGRTMEESQDHGDSSNIVEPKLENERDSEVWTTSATGLDQTPAQTKDNSQKEESIANAVMSADTPSGTTGGHYPRAEWATEREEKEEKDRINVHEQSEVASLLAEPETAPSDRIAEESRNMLVGPDENVPESTHLPTVTDNIDDFDKVVPDSKERRDEKDRENEVEAENRREVESEVEQQVSNVNENIVGDALEGDVQDSDVTGRSIDTLQFGQKKKKKDKKGKKKSLVLETETAEKPQSGESAESGRGLKALTEAGILAGEASFADEAGNEPFENATGEAKPQEDVEIAGESGWAPPSAKKKKNKKGRSNQADLQTGPEPEPQTKNLESAQSQRVPTVDTLGEDVVLGDSAAGTLHDGNAKRDEGTKPAEDSQQYEFVGKRNKDKKGKQKRMLAEPEIVPLPGAEPPSEEEPAVKAMHNADRETEPEKDLTDHAEEPNDSKDLATVDNAEESNSSRDLGHGGEKTGFMGIVGSLMSATGVAAVANAFTQSKAHDAGEAPSQTQPESSAAETSNDVEEHLERVEEPARSTSTIATAVNTESPAVPDQGSEATTSQYVPSETSHSEPTEHMSSAIAIPSQDIPEPSPTVAGSDVRINADHDSQSAETPMAVSSEAEPRAAILESLPSTKHATNESVADAVDPEAEWSLPNEVSRRKSKKGKKPKRDRGANVDEGFESRGASGQQSKIDLQDIVNAVITTDGIAAVASFKAGNDSPKETSDGVNPATASDRSEPEITAAVVGGANSDIPDLSDRRPDATTFESDPVEPSDANFAVERQRVPAGSPTAVESQDSDTDQNKESLAPNKSDTIDMPSSNSSVNLEASDITPEVIKDESSIENHETHRAQSDPSYGETDEFKQHADAETERLIGSTVQTIAETPTSMDHFQSDATPAPISRKKGKKGKQAKKSFEDWKPSTEATIDIDSIAAQLSSVPAFSHIESGPSPESDLQDNLPPLPASRPSTPSVGHEEISAGDAKLADILPQLPQSRPPTPAVNQEEIPAGDERLPDILPPLPASRPSTPGVEHEEIPAGDAKLADILPPWPQSRPHTPTVNQGKTPAGDERLPDILPPLPQSRPSTPGCKEEDVFTEVDKPTLTEESGIPDVNSHIHDKKNVTSQGTDVEQDSSKKTKKGKKAKKSRATLTSMEDEDSKTKSFSGDVNIHGPGMDQANGHTSIADNVGNSEPTLESIPPERSTSKALGENMSETPTKSEDTWADEPDIDNFTLKSSKKDRKKGKKGRKSTLDDLSENKTPQTYMSSDGLSTDMGDGLGVTAIAAAMSASLAAGIATGDDERSVVLAKKSKKERRKDKKNSSSISALEQSEMSEEQSRENIAEGNSTRPLDPAQVDATFVNVEASGPSESSNIPVQSDETALPSPLQGKSNDLHESGTEQAGERKNNKADSSPAQALSEADLAWDNQIQPAESRKQRDESNDDGSNFQSAPTSSVEDSTIHLEQNESSLRAEGNGQERELDSRRAGSQHTDENRKDSSEATVVQSHDIDFAATLAAGLADSGFDPNLVIDDANFHRRTSPPRAVAEADPEETFTLPLKKNKKGKRAKRLQADADIEESVESGNIAMGSTNTPEAATDDFDGVLSQALSESGFDPAILQQVPSSGTDSPQTIEDAESDVQKSLSNRNKGKKLKRTSAGLAMSTASNEGSAADQSNNPAGNASVETSLDESNGQGPLYDNAQPRDGNRESSESENVQKISLSDPLQLDSSEQPSADDVDKSNVAADPTELFAVAGERDMDVDQMDEVYRAYKKREKRNRKKQKPRGLEAETVPTLDSVATATSTTSTDQPVTIQDVQDAVKAGEGIIVPVPQGPYDAVYPTFSSGATPSTVQSVFPGLQRVKSRKSDRARNTEGVEQRSKYESGSVSGHEHEHSAKLVTEPTIAQPLDTEAAITLEEYVSGVEHVADNAQSNLATAETGTLRATSASDDRNTGVSPSWTFDALEGNASTLEDQNVTATHGYTRAMDNSLQESIGGQHERQSTASPRKVINPSPSLESLHRRRSQEPLRISTPTKSDWDLQVSKGRSRDDATPTGSRARNTSGGTDDTPLEPTTKNRTSYLFQSPPQLSGIVEAMETPLTSNNQDVQDVRESRPYGSTDDEVTRQVSDNAESPNGQNFGAGDDHSTLSLSPAAVTGPGLLQSIAEEKDTEKRSIDGSDNAGPIAKSIDRTPTPQSIRRLKHNGNPQSLSTHASATVARGSGTDRVHPVDNPLSTDDLIKRLSWPTVDEDTGTVNIDRSLARPRSTRPIAPDHRSPSVMSNRSNTSGAIFKSPEDLRSYSRASNRSLTPTLRRVDRSLSGDLRAASRRGDSGSAVGSTMTIPFEAPPTPPPNNGDVIEGSEVRDLTMADDVFVSRSYVLDDPHTEIALQQGYGGAQRSNASPTRPPSVRKRQSMHIVDLESRLDQLVAENRALQEARSSQESSSDQHDVDGQVLREALEARELQLQEKEAEINQMRAVLQPLQAELERLSEINVGLTESNKNLVDDANGRYATLQAEHADAHEKWQSTSRELESVRMEHGKLTTGMKDIVELEIANALADKNAEILRLREQLDVATEQIRALQVQIQSSQSNDLLTIRDEDYFDGACQKLCQHVQQWVLRFSKLSDNRVCRLSTELDNDRIEQRLDNAILDGSDVDRLLGDRVRRRDVFMSVVMTMAWEYVFTRYLFGMDREQRQKLKALEKILAEVGPPRAIAQWRATTLTLLCKRPDFGKQCQLDTEAVAHEIFAVLCSLLPPPSSSEQQLLVSLQKVMAIAVDLSIEMRTQRAEFIMLPPLQPEYDTNGELIRKVHFNASLMNERSGLFNSNEELERGRAVVKVVLFPLVVKKGDESGEGEEEIVVCPAQVLVQHDGGKGKKVVRVMSGAMEIDDARKSRQSLISTAGTSMGF